jgi:hypothetical protein
MAITAEKQRVKTSLSEVRSIVLGAQILVGFQYRAAFEPRFAALPPGAQYLQVAALVLLVASMALMIAPAPYHRIAAAGQATVDMERTTKWMGLSALALFALALAADFGVALPRQLGLPGACALGAAVASAALLCWFGPAFARRRPAEPRKDEMVPTKERITELLTEARIILPGVQALLGFQFASYLTQTFDKLSPAGQAVNTASLLLLVLAMVLLMTPAPYHRLAEDGEDTERFERIAERLVLASLPPLALGVAGDVFVVTEIVLGTAAGIAVALACAIGMAALWFGVPLLAARHDPG